MEFHWHIIKEPIAEAIGLSHPTLHVLFGAAIFTSAAWLLRKRKWLRFYAWLITLALEIVNETGDAYAWIGWTGYINIKGTIQDILLTMSFPTFAVIVLILMKYRKA